MAGAISADFIIPCYNERDNVVPLFRAFEEAFGASGVDWHLILVDDGSSDGTFEQVRLIAASPRVRAIRFSRNFGKEAAIYAGLQAAEADYVGIVDADLQQPPAVALEMLQLLASDEACDCVAAYQESRNEGAFVSFAKTCFYRLFAWMTDAQPEAMDASDFRVFTKAVADAICEMGEFHRFSKGLFAWVGFNVRAFPYVAERRNAGESKWSVRSLFAYAFEGLFSFSTKPLSFITKFGALISVLALAYAVVLIVRTLVLGVDVPGYASLLSFILLFGGGQFLAIGVLGEYLSRAYIQVKQRPVYLVKETIDGRDAQRPRS